MCGIAGSVERGAVDGADPLDARLDLVGHRGPDSRGVFRAGPTAIGQNRLAIIDLATGDPPITNEDGSVAVVLNGEIYNYRALRSELERSGHRLTSHGDTEVIAHLAEMLPPEAIARRLDGMFAFAVWDDRRRRLVLGRDRLGKKPLYYHVSDGTLVFGSELKSVLAHPSVPRRLDPEAIPAYLKFGYVPTPRTFYDEVRSLPPAHVLVLDHGEAPRIDCYWRRPIVGVSEDRIELTLDDAAAEVRSLLTGAVERRLVSDVPLGAFLSGGVDSSAIVAIMAGLMDEPVRTFTIGFDDRDGFDEREYAAAIAKRYRTDHTEFVVAPEAVDLVERLVWHHDQPFGDSSAVPTYLLSELTRQHVTVALSGDGGDELFAGYERFSAAMAVEAYAKVPPSVRRPAEALLDRLPAHLARGRVGSLQRFARRADAGLPDSYGSWVSYVADDQRQLLLDVGDDWAMREYRTLWAESEGAQLIDRLLDLNLRTYLLDDLLVKADRMSMAHGLEVRSPLLDTALVELAMRLPPSTKLRGWSRKRVLKRAVADLLPRELLRRRKRGFGVPLDRWFREDLRTYMQSMLGQPTARVRRQVSPERLDALIAEHQAGRRGHGHALWTLLTLEVFLRREGW